MFRKKKTTTSNSSSKGSSSVPRAVVSPQHSIPLHLDINRSPLFARRHSDRPVILIESSQTKGADSQTKASVGGSVPTGSASRHPLSLSTSVPLTLAGEPVIDISPVVTKVRTPQLKEVLGGNILSDSPPSGATSPVYADIYEPGRTSSDSCQASQRQEGGTPLAPRDGELTPLTPISPLNLSDTFNRRPSDFCVRSSPGVAVHTPTLVRKSSNAIVFDNLKALLESPEAGDDNFPTFTSVCQAAPKKLVTTRVSLIPHPPIVPVDISSLKDPLPSTANSEMEETSPAKADVIARQQQQQRPLPPLPVKGAKQTPSTNSPFPTNNVESDQADDTYQPIDRHSRSSGSNLSLHSAAGGNSSLTRDESDRQHRGAMMEDEVKMRRNFANTFLQHQESQHGNESSVRATTPSDHVQSGGPSSPPWSTPEDVASETSDLTRPSSSWSPVTQNRFTQFISSNASTLSMLPQDKIETLFRQRYMGRLNLEEVLEEEPPDFLPPPPSSNHKNTGMSLESMVCTRCGEGFEPQEKIVNSNGQLWHTQCFVCSQCFRAFPDDVFYEFEGRRYCEHDFQVLFAPCCGKCNEFIIGRVIKAMNNNWHPRCFTCSECHKELADLGFIRNMGHAMCHDCNARLKAQSLNKYMCHKCHSVIDGEPLRWRGDTYHPYHFNCANCEVELTHQAREVKSRPGYAANQMNELYCLRCHDKMGIPICGACRRPIEERVVTALGKHWHVEHFVCIKCEKPFFGNRHYEKKGQAYCEVHYHELFGNLCFVCNQVIYGDVVTALNKAWCTHHFACVLCDVKMTQKSKFFEFDQRPICKKCYEKLPQELKKRLKRQHDIQARGGKPIA